MVFYISSTKADGEKMKSALLSGGGVRDRIRPELQELHRVLAESWLGLENVVFGPCFDAFEYFW